MKKAIVAVLAIMVLFTFSACKKQVTPMEKLDSFMAENGKQDAESYVLEYDGAVEIVKERDFTIANMENLKASPTVEFKIMKNAEGITLELVDRALTDNGMKMERTVKINPDGTFEFYNGLVMNGVDMGLHLNGEIPVETYNKDIIPVITDSKLAPGAKLNDAAKATMKDYIDLTLECYSAALAQEGLGLTMADVGYAAFDVK